MRHSFVVCTASPPRHWGGLIDFVPGFGAGGSVLARVALALIHVDVTM